MQICLRKQTLGAKRMGHVTRQIYLSPYLTETPQKKPSAKQHNQTKKKTYPKRKKNYGWLSQAQQLRYFLILSIP